MGERFGAVVFQVAASDDTHRMPPWMWIEPLSATISIQDLEATFPNPEQKNSAGLFLEHRTEIECCVRLIAAQMRVRPDEPLKITAADLAGVGRVHHGSDSDAHIALADMVADRSIALAAKASCELPPSTHSG